MTVHDRRHSPSAPQTDPRGRRRRRRRRATAGGSIASCGPPVTIGGEIAEDATAEAIEHGAPAAAWSARGWAWSAPNAGWGGVGAAAAAASDACAAAVLAEARYAPPGQVRVEQYDML